ncbi:hypothetical protein [Francisella uliginis]|uniref:Uncharacterized protein n=1 Tax=Francisella uliginis TaxID=573570 RepID=A0A1L4BPU0_9GAMM|nr:hypothetical protein [Francisella uliginis]API85852.1 hypothetical protein F7310_00110 [Francisella uliginis]
MDIGNFISIVAIIVTLLIAFSRPYLNKSGFFFTRIRVTEELKGIHDFYERLDKNTNQYIKLMMKTKIDFMLSDLLYKELRCSINNLDQIQKVNKMLEKITLKEFSKLLISKALIIGPKDITIVKYNKLICGNLKNVIFAFISLFIMVLLLMLGIYLINFISVSQDTSAKFVGLGCIVMGYFFELLAIRAEAKYLSRKKYIKIIKKNKLSNILND